MSLALLLCVALQTGAMSYEQARNEALFLTDKMAYELNLTPQQYDAAYEINLDYLMGVTSVDDVYSTYWTRRNLDLSYILLDWQWRAFRAATYFYRPLYWNAGYWHFSIYSRYPRRNYFYFSLPTVYISYRGGHSWRSNGGRSYYHSHREHFRPKKHTDGLRDKWNRGEFSGKRGGSSNSSTHVTVNRPESGKNFGGSRTGGTFSSARNPNNTVSSGKTSSSGGTFRLERNPASTINRQPSTATKSAGRSFSTQKTSNGTLKTNSPAARSSSFGTSRNGGSFGNVRNSSSAVNRHSTKSPSVRSNSFGGSRNGSPAGSRSSGPNGKSVDSGSFKNRR